MLCVRSSWLLSINGASKRKTKKRTRKEKREVKNTLTSTFIWQNTLVCWQRCTATMIWYISLLYTTYTCKRARTHTHTNAQHTPISATSNIFRACDWLMLNVAQHNYSRQLQPVTKSGGQRWLLSFRYILKFILWRTMWNQRLLVMRCTTRPVCLRHGGFQTLMHVQNTPNDPTETRLFLLPTQRK